MAEASRSRGFIGSVRRLFAGRHEDVSSLSAPAEVTATPDVSPDPRIAVLLAEWQDIRQTGRHFGGERLVRLAEFMVAYAAIAGPYLAVAAHPAGRLGLVRWALPALGLLVGLEFLALEVGALTVARITGRRGRQVETALEALLAGSGRIRPPRLATEGLWEAAEIGAWAAAALYGLLALGWLAALVATAAGWLPGSGIG